MNVKELDVPLWMQEVPLSSAPFLFDSTFLFLFFVFCFCFFFQLLQQATSSSNLGAFSGIQQMAGKS